MNITKSITVVHKRRKFENTAFCAKLMLDVTLRTKTCREMLWQEYQGHAPTSDLCIGCFLYLEWFHHTPIRHASVSSLGHCSNVLFFVSSSLTILFLIAIPSILSLPRIHTQSSPSFMFYFHHSTYHHPIYYILYFFVTAWPPTER